MCILIKDWARFFAGCSDAVDGKLLTLRRRFNGDLGRHSTWEHLCGRIYLWMLQDGQANAKHIMSVVIFSAAPLVCRESKLGVVVFWYLIYLPGIYHQPAWWFWCWSHFGTQLFVAHNNFRNPAAAHEAHDSKHLIGLRTRLLITGILRQFPGAGSILGMKWVFQAQENYSYK